MAPAAELLTFARLHTEEGRAPDGTDLLVPAAIAEMQEPQVESPLPGEEQALGWTVRRWGRLTCLGQDADTIGQRAFLRVVPERRFALCVLTNSPPGAALARELIARRRGGAARRRRLAGGRAGVCVATARCGAPQRQL